MHEDILKRALSFAHEWLQDRYEREEVPGFVVAVSYRGHILLNEAFGYANLERRIPMTTDHVFRIASHSKTFTATAVMQLVETGRLKLDDAVVDYIPWLSNNADRRWSHVTIRQLMSHGAGVIRDGFDTDYWSLRRDFPDTQEFIDEISQIDLVLDNNQQMKYSNYGYTLLGLIIEATSGESYNDFVLNHIVKPLGLAHTFPEYRPHLHEPNPSDLVTGYSRRDLKVRRPLENVDTKAMSPATGFAATAGDLCRYFTAHMQGSGELLHDESKKEMQRAQWPQRSADGTVLGAYGLGFFLKTYGKRETFGHSGGFPGCITNTMADPNDQLVVVALTNAIDGPAESLVSGLYSIISYFQEEITESPYRSLEGHFTNLWESVRMVATGQELRAVYGAGWNPLAMVEKLIPDGDLTFRIARTGSGGSQGEHVRFIVKDGHVERVIDAGATLWPRAVWLRHHEEAATTQP